MSPFPRSGTPLSPSYLFGTASEIPATSHTLSSERPALATLMRKKIHKLPALGALLSLLLLSSCATDRSVRSRLPTYITVNKDAGAGGPLVIMIGLQPGEKSPFLLDTGAPVTCFDKSLEPRLGAFLRTGTGYNFGVTHDISVYTAPTLYLGSTPLTMTGAEVITFDFKQTAPERVRPYVAILGMDVLEHYCIQIDFAAHRIRFLADAPVDRSAWGKPFPLTALDDGCVSISDNLVGGKGPGSLIDTGYTNDGWLTPELFQQWTNDAVPPADGEVHSPNARLGGYIYSDMHLDAIDPKLLSSDDSHIKLNGIGLHFLSRHLVTLDFPNHTMYLKRTRTSPLVSRDIKAAANAAVKYLHSLKKRGQLPGWSKEDQSANKTEVLQFRYPDSATFDHVLKKGDSSIYHYKLTRAAHNRPWKLQRAWRTDQNGRTLEEYSLP